MQYLLVHFVFCTALFKFCKFCVKRTVEFPVTTGFPVHKVMHYTHIHSSVSVLIPSDQMTHTHGLTLAVLKVLHFLVYINLRIAFCTFYVQFCTGAVHNNYNICRSIINLNMSICKTHVPLLPLAFYSI